MANVDTFVYPVLVAAVAGMLAGVAFFRTRHRRTVFVSYRRDDAAAETAVIAAALARRFGDAQVYHDVRSAVPGESYREVIAQTLRRCDATVVVIGPRWATLALDGAKGPRLFEADDLVCAEVAQALNAGMRVVPLLVSDARLPTDSDLPPQLARLPEHHALTWRGAGDQAALEQLGAAIAAAPIRHTPAFLAVCHGGGLLVLVMFRWTDGFVADEFSTAAGIVLPGVATSLAAWGALQWHRALVAARSAWISLRELAIPLAFLAALTIWVIAAGFRIGDLTFEGFKVGLVAIEVAWAAYTGVALARMFASPGWAAERA